MTTTEHISHPYRIALENRDGGALAAALHLDVVLDTPAFDTPIYGRDRVLAFFIQLATVVADLKITDELWGERTHAISFRLRVDGHPIEGVDYLQLGEEDLVKRITVTARPLASVQVLAERMADTVAKLSAPEPSST